MAKIGIVGDGPGGLSAALFLAKAGHDVTVYGRNETAMNHAFLNNYVGIPHISGVDFQRVASAQARDLGARFVDINVSAVRADADDITIVAEGTEPTPVDYLILTEGKSAPIATSLGIVTPDGPIVDRNGRTKVNRVYLVGRSARPKRSQAIISAGDGAAAALDILSDISGADVQDWDAPPKTEP